MLRRSVRQAVLGAAAALCALTWLPPRTPRTFSPRCSARSEAAGRRPLRCRCRSQARVVSSIRKVTQPRRAPAIYGGAQAYCVRTCDGRYFPISASDSQSRAASCNSFCPASETKVVYGSNIDNAATESGKPYSELPNAFRYRNELVAGCTCNGKDQIGLAPVKIENDPTLRKGDIVAGADGLMVAGRGADKRGASLNLSPASRKDPLRAISGCRWWRRSDRR